MNRDRVRPKRNPFSSVRSMLDYWCPPVVIGRSCIGYVVKAHDIDLLKPIVVLKIDHTHKTIHIGNK
jgi:hypothetical protein